MADIHSFLGVGPVPAGAPLRRMNSISLPRNRLGGALLASGRSAQTRSGHGPTTLCEAGCEEPCWRRRPAPDGPRGGNAAQGDLPS